MERFGELLFEAIDDTIRLVFGEFASDLIYGFVERHVSLERQEIGEKIEVFCACLEKLLGSERALIVQGASLKRLCLKLRREYEEVERYFAILDELFEIKFKLLVPVLKEKSFVCN